MKVGCDFLKPVVDAIDTGIPIDLIELTRQEILTTNTLSDSLGPGEAESIAACLRRSNASLLTNDKRARNLCRERNLPCRDLPGILRDLWTRGTTTKSAVKGLLEKIETEQGMVIKNQSAILEPVRKKNAGGEESNIVS